MESGAQRGEGSVMARLTGAVLRSRACVQPTHWTRLDRDYETIRVHMETRFTDLGITTTATAA